MMGGEVVGRLRSAGYGFTTKRNIAYTYLPIDRTKAGLPIEVEVFGQRIPGRVEADVMHDPEGKRLTA
jgi:glycine cleavage system aminomethyltransferase T